ncbi:probable G-protein coupled receptor 82 [Eucyclogobius newberryi]|uniref:probable G-protein coupled receptor 82 n=1 Tax=Eucyclogobius newberryi TaxID=166745 RepID=UPI003B59D22B
MSLCSIDQMEYSTSPVFNSRHASSSVSLCSTSATLIFLPLAYALIFLTALPGNMLSLWVFHRRMSNVSPISVYLSHLSLSNLILSLTTPFLGAYYRWGTIWTFRGFLCQLVLHAATPILHINIYIGLMILTWVAVSRFVSLLQHTHAPRPSGCLALMPTSVINCLKKVSFARGVCVAVWFINIGAIVPVTVFYSVNEAMSANETKSEEGVCYNPTVEVGGSTSAACNLSAITIFYFCYALVLLSYLTVIRHIRRSRRSAPVATSQSLLGRVFRNIVVIQIVLSVCLLPYHIFKPIFISLASKQTELTPAHGIISCHPLSGLVEVKNGLLLLAALRGSTDPVMYFLLDKTFRQQTLRLFGKKQNTGLGSGGAKPGQAGDCSRTTANSSCTF